MKVLRIKRGKRIRGLDSCYLCRKRRGEIKIGYVYYCNRCASNIKIDQY